VFGPQSAINGMTVFNTAREARAHLHQWLDCGGGPGGEDGKATLALAAALRSNGRDQELMLCCGTLMAWLVFPVPDGGDPYTIGLTTFAEWKPLTHSAFMDSLASRGYSDYMERPWIWFPPGSPAAGWS
jgi:hypothetical protein